MYVIFVVCRYVNLCFISISYVNFSVCSLCIFLYVTYVSLCFMYLKPYFMYDLHRLESMMNGPWVT